MPRIVFPPSAPVRLSAAQALAAGMELSTLYGMALSPADVARVLGKARVRYVVVGAHAINLYTGRPRATRDINVLTDAPSKARRAVEAAYPHLAVEDYPVVVRFKDSGVEVLDLIKARSSKVFRRGLRLVTEVRTAGQVVVLPTAEAALAMKFASMTNRNRPTNDRLQDAVDFSRAAERQTSLDESLLHELGELVYPGDGDELMKFVADSRAGRRLDL